MSYDDYGDYGGGGELTFPDNPHEEDLLENQQTEYAGRR